MADEKITINWDELETRRVDTRLREQSAMERNRAYAQTREEELPVASGPSRSSVWNNAIVCMTVFGLLGGILAWGVDEAMDGPLRPVVGSLIGYDPAAHAKADEFLKNIQQIQAKHDLHQYDDTTAQGAIEEVKALGKHNAYFVVLDPDSKLSDKQRKSKLEVLQSDDHVAEFFLNTLSYGLCGMMIALCLAVAEPITQRKRKATLINGTVGAVAGLIGGAAAAYLSGRISTFAGSVTAGDKDWVKQLAIASAVWGTLGLFIGIGSGLAAGSVKKIAVGMLGGLLGGLIGGALFHPIQTLANNNEAIGKLIALIAIGVVAGLATGLLENVIKAGWLKVTTGIIAGKQFILYRNPTYIGSSPDCQIYLFKDKQVGKRHAAIHLLAGGIEIEDLPLGIPTLINGKPIGRAKLKNGDTIQVGNTSFEFHEKRPSSKK
ncbi:MAG TPA: FHA domain-containing protein [Tepidisphaeraceae bacterium]|jgi:hypothetical protein|nr:FHA domain-containing protein [Tepidisphaeraceae bacterium]